MKEAFDLFKDKDGRLPIGYIDKAVRATGILPSHYEIQQLIAETQAEGNTLDPEGNRSHALNPLYIKPITHIMFRPTCTWTHNVCI